jgi:hypothetical protein
MLGSGISVCSRATNEHRIAATRKSCARSRRCLPGPARPVSGLPRRHGWSAFAPAWRSWSDGIRRLRCNSPRRIAGRGICLSLYVGAMDWHRIAITASGAIRLWYARRKTLLIGCMAGVFRARSHASDVFARGDSACIRKESLFRYERGAGSSRGSAAELIAKIRLQRGLARRDRCSRAATG